MALSRSVFNIISLCLMQEVVKSRISTIFCLENLMSIGSRLIYNSIRGILVLNGGLIVSFTKQLIVKKESS